MIRRAPHNINHCSITSLRACMVSCFLQSGSAPSLENPFQLKLLKFHSMSSINFPTSAFWTLRTWRKALNSFEKRLVKLHEKLGPGCDVHIRHTDIWVVLLKTTQPIWNRNKHIVTEQSWNRKCMKVSGRYSKNTIPITISFVSCSMSIAKMVWRFPESVRPRDVFSFEAGHRRV